MCPMCRKCDYKDEKEQDECLKDRDECEQKRKDCHEEQRKLIERKEYCQAQVQVPNPLSQRAPNPDPKVSPSLKKPQNPILWTGLTQ